MKRLFVIIFIGFSMLYLGIISIGREDIAWFLKPLLLPILLYGVAVSNNFPTKNLLLTALAFSWLGDIILMFSEKGALYFIIGLVAFLVSHIFYIVVFTKQKSKAKVTANIFFWLSGVLVLLYLKNMLTLLYPILGDLKIPVTIYAATISLMLIVACRGFFSWNDHARYLILFGAVCFVVSDSLLAINKFYSPLPDASFWIMITYLTAQFCISAGILKLARVENRIRETVSANQKI